MKAAEIRKFAQQFGAFVDRLDRRAQTDLELAEQGQKLARVLDAFANEATRNEKRKRKR